MKNIKNTEKNPDNRFTDQKYTIYDFMDEILVTCPNCNGRAIIKPVPGEEYSIFTDRRLICTDCGTTMDKKAKSVLLRSDGAPVDSYFELPLWLKAGRGEKTLWVYNKRHLEYIESFVEATHRMRNKRTVPGCSNCSIISRLPRWVKKGSSRKQILSLIQKLKDRLND